MTFVRTRRRFIGFTLGWVLWLPLAAAADGIVPNAPLAPPFVLADDRGVEHSFPSGDAGVDIYLFWATWCPYCKALMPHLQSLRDEYGEQVRVYAFDIRDDGNPRAVLDEQGYDFTLLPAADAVSELYGVLATPGVYLVDRSGRIRFNLYTLITGDNAAFEKLNHARKAARRAPWWAAEIRRAIDRILAGEAGSAGRPAGSGS